MAWNAPRRNDLEARRSAAPSDFTDSTGLMHFSGGLHAPAPMIVETIAPFLPETRFLRICPKAWIVANKWGATLTGPCTECPTTSRR